MRVVAITCFWLLRASLGSASFLVALPYLVPAFWLPLTIPVPSFPVPGFQVRFFFFFALFSFLSLLRSLGRKEARVGRNQASSFPSSPSVFWLLAVFCFSPHSISSASCMELLLHPSLVHSGDNHHHPRRVLGRRGIQGSTVGPKAGRNTVGDGAFPKLVGCHWTALDRREWRGRDAWHRHRTGAT